MSRTQPSPAFKWETAEARFEDALRLHRKRVESVLPDGIEIVFRSTDKAGGVWTLGRRSAVNLRLGRAAWPDCRVECEVSVFLRWLQGTLSIEDSFETGVL